MNIIMGILMEWWRDMAKIASLFLPEKECYSHDHLLQGCGKWNKIILPSTTNLTPRSERIIANGSSSSQYWVDWEILTFNAVPSRNASYVAPQETLAWLG
jgi:hypothetical protein